MGEKELDWQPGRWWRVIDPDGSLWCETSDEDEARERMRPGDHLQRLWVARLDEWRDCNPAPPATGPDEPSSD